MNNHFAQKNLRLFADNHKIFICLLAAAKSEPLKILPPEPDNTTDVEACTRKAKANDQEMTRININNIKEVKADVLKELLNALKENTVVQTLEMANVGMTDSVGRVCLFYKKKIHTPYAKL